MKRYSIPTKTKALNLIKTLELEKEQTVSKDIHGIMIWGFEDRQISVIDKDGVETFKIIKGKTYNVDVVWKVEAPVKWEQYEVNPSSPSHTVS
jgi:hypothetical protein